jgi:YbbR domain-containing protein
LRAFLRALASQWQLKLLAFALAMLLWVVVSGEQLQSRLIPLPLDVHVSDPAYQLVEESVPDQVDVRFVGPGREFIEMMLRRPHIVLDVAEVQDTSEVFSLEPGMVQATGQNITARTVDPSRIRLRFHRRSSRSVPVRVLFGPGYNRTWTVLDSLTVEPESVLVTGAASVVEKVGIVPSVPLRIGVGDSIVDRRIGLDAASLRGLTLSPATIHVRGRTDRILERTISGVPVSLGGDLVLIPDTVSVHLRGPRSIVEALQPADLRIAVAIDSIPETIPDDGIVVPLRADPPRSGVQAAPIPVSARLFPRAEPEAALPQAEGGGR